MKRQKIQMLILCGLLVLVATFLPFVIIIIIRQKKTQKKLLMQYLLTEADVKEFSLLEEVKRFL